MFQGTFLSCFKILPFKATKYVLEHPEVFQFHKRPRRLSHQGYHGPFHKHSENSVASLTRSWLTEKVKVSLKEQALRRQTALPHVLLRPAVVFSAASSPSPLTREGLNKSPGTERNCRPFLARQPQCSARVCAIIQPLYPDFTVLKYHCIPHRKSLRYQQLPREANNCQGRAWRTFHSNFAYQNNQKPTKKAYTENPAISTTWRNTVF